jgi:hypothetical protein
MKKYFTIFRMMILGSLMLPMVSCEEEDPQKEINVVPPPFEVKVPDGYVNYLEEAVHLDYSAQELKVTLEINADWYIRVYDRDAWEYEPQWCSVTPSSGTAGLNEITISLSENCTKRFRIADLRIGKSRVSYEETITIRQDEKKYEDPVDLGLSVKWASWNLGAHSAEEFGGKYSWGATGSSGIGSWADYDWCEGSWDTMTKYCTNSYYGIVDNKSILDPEDDFANRVWGNGWRVPTILEMAELVYKCEWIYIELNGVKGFRVIGPNGNKIFLPGTGTSASLNYWTSTLDSDDNRNAYALGYDSFDPCIVRNLRCYNEYIRPVID